MVQALSKNSALPVPEAAAAGGRSRGSGGGGDTWRDDSDEETDEGQEPLDQVRRASSIALSKMQQLQLRFRLLQR